MKKFLFRERGILFFLLFMVYSVIFPVYIFALPQGGKVVAGDAAISVPDANNMNITQGTNKAIINWKGFSIGRPEAVRFLQPGSSSIALNRVMGVDPSLIYGELSANGRIFLINPNGILVGETGRINVNSFLASTLDMADSDFLAGNYVFSQTLGSSLASILNQGTIEAAPGGFVSLLSPGIQNEGTIVASMGKVHLASGEKVTLNFAGNELIGFAVDESVMGEVQGPDGEPLESNITNKGIISADGGEVILSTRSAYDAIKSVVNNEGIIEAKSLSKQNGKIVLNGGEKGVVENSGILNASGRSATTNIPLSQDDNTTLPLSQRGTEGDLNNGDLTGGEVHILGEKVGLFDTAKIDVSGDRGGGTVLIGGDFQGKNPEIRNAKRTYIGPDVSITADAITEGDGGKVIVWSDDTTEFSGQISARGGLNSGDGGFAEVSGKKHLLITGHADLRATDGKVGTLLLDPGSVTIQSGGDVDPAPDYNVINDGWINNQLIGAAIEITTANSTDGLTEDITVSGTSITLANLLTLTAGNDISSGGSFTGTGGLTLTAGGGINLNNTDFSLITAGALQMNVGSGGTLDSGTASGISNFDSANANGTNSTVTGIVNYDVATGSDGAVSYSGFTTINGDDTG
ncbi:MAG: filamentous hemagglutinin N-terminal domain-containing protein, partial [Deltaproteobacteria bacterium]|nr:filamentous hemagglutinin N-terminal domain-containing protein [Deltaproteobacteria bacterium]